MSSYFQFDEGLRPTFATIEKDFQNEILPNCKNFFFKPAMASEPRQRTETRPRNRVKVPQSRALFEWFSLNCLYLTSSSHVSSDRSQRSTTTTFVDFIDSREFDPTMPDQQNYENYQKITQSRGRPKPTFIHQISQLSHGDNDVFAEIRFTNVGSLNLTKFPGHQTCPVLSNLHLHRALKCRPNWTTTTFRALWTIWTTRTDRDSQKALLWYLLRRCRHIRKSCMKLSNQKFE